MAFAPLVLAIVIGTVVGFARRDRGGCHFRVFGVEFVDPRPFLIGKLRDTFDIYPNIGSILPAMGYGEEQLRDLEATINATDCDAVVVGTPIDLARIVDIEKPNTRVFYDLQEIGQPNLDGILDEFVDQHGLV